MSGAAAASERPLSEAEQRVEGLADALEAQARAFALLAPSLHASGAINGRRLAAALRLDRTGRPEGDATLIEMGNLVGRCVDSWEAGEGIGPRAVAS